MRGDAPAHGWLTPTDVRHVRIPPFLWESHVRKAENRPVCAHRRVCARQRPQHLRPVGFHACACTSAPAHVRRHVWWNSTWQAADSLSPRWGYCSRSGRTAVLRPVTSGHVEDALTLALCSVTSTDSVQAQMAVLKSRWVCNHKRRAATAALCASALFETTGCMRRRCLCLRLLGLCLHQFRSFSRFVEPCRRPCFVFPVLLW